MGSNYLNSTTPKREKIKGQLFGLNLDILKTFDSIITLKNIFIVKFLHILHVCKFSR